MAPHVEPRFAVEPGRVDHQHIPIPPADGISEPGWIRIPGQGPAIQEDLAELAEDFVENDHQAGLLNDLERAIAGVENRNSWRQATGGRPLASPRRPFLSEHLGPRLDGKL